MEGGAGRRGGDSPPPRSVSNPHAHARTSMSRTPPRMAPDARPPRRCPRRPRRTGLRACRVLVERARCTRRAPDARAHGATRENQTAMPGTVIAQDIPPLTTPHINLWYICTMRTGTRPLLAKRDILMQHLRDQGFTVALTATGFIAVDEDGVVFNVSPARTHCVVVHPVSGIVIERKVAGQAEIEWLDRVCGDMVEWLKG